jgi:hypothetical protein
MCVRFSTLPADGLCLERDLEEGTPAVWRTQWGMGPQRNATRIDMNLRIAHIGRLVHRARASRTTESRHEP